MPLGVRFAAEYGPKAAAAAARAWSWFRDKISQLREPSWPQKPSPGKAKPAVWPRLPSVFTKDAGIAKIHSVGEGTIGSLVMFSYDPKHKKTLPYYDRFPVSFIIGLYSDGFLGINMHYLSPVLRSALMNALWQHVEGEVDEKSRIKASYSTLMSASASRYIAPCVKRYLSGHVRSRITVISPLEWDRVVMLPLQKFEKASAEHVWRESARMTR